MLQTEALTAEWIRLAADQSMFDREWAARIERVDHQLD